MDRPDLDLHVGPASTAVFDDMARDDTARLGFVPNFTRLWAHVPGAKPALFALMDLASTAAGLTTREMAVLVTASASARRDPYCAIAWGTRLANEADVETALAVAGNHIDSLGSEDRLLASWATSVVDDPRGITRADVDRLRAAGFDDARIAALTVYVALRMAFSTVNGALGARPDREFVDRAPEPLRRAVGC